MRKINLTNFQVATSLTARDINRRIILNVIRTRQPVSRADVARLTGLQRSTVSLIADQLIDEGWIAEGELGRLPRGRRPTYLHLNAEGRGIIGIDIRTYSTTVALADLNGKFLDQESFPTNRIPGEFVVELAARVKALMKRHSATTFEGIGLSVPGRINRKTQEVALALHLGWRDLDIRTALEKATKLPVEIENAANACALAENYFSPESDSHENMVVVSVSEGVGTGLVINGQIVRGATGMAGEFGHISLDPAGPKCKCGNFGCWEMMAGNNAALQMYRNAIAGTNGNGSAGKLRGKKLTIDLLLQLAQDGDQVALGVVEEIAQNLGRGMAILITAFDPSRIVVVGEITRMWDRVGPIIKRSMEKCTICSKSTEVIPSDDALQPRLRGTIALVLEKHLGAPRVA